MCSFQFLKIQFLPALLIFLSAPVFAGEDCVFDEGAYLKFIKQYQAHNKNSMIKPDGRTLVVQRDDETITITGGGCVHLGESIAFTTRRKLSEQQFLEKTLELAIEYGDWLINTRELKKSIDSGKVQKMDGVYYIDIDAMTVFSASYDKQGKITIDFFIN